MLECPFYYDDDNIGVNGNGGNDYASKEYPFFNHVWHWLSPFKVVNVKNRHAVEARILIEAGQAVDDCMMTKEKVFHSQEDAHGVRTAHLCHSIGLL